MRSLRIRVAALWATLRRTPASIEEFDRLCCEAIESSPVPNKISPAFLPVHVLQAELLLLLVQSKEAKEPVDVLDRALQTIDCVISSADRSKYEYFWMHAMLVRGEILVSLAKETGEAIPLELAIASWHRILPLLSDKNTTRWARLNLNIGSAFAGLERWSEAIVAYGRAIRVRSSRRPVEYIGGAFSLIEALLERGEAGDLDKAKSLVRDVEALHMSRPHSKLGIYRTVVLLTVVNRIRYAHDADFRSQENGHSELRALADWVLTNGQTDFMAARLLTIVGQLLILRSLMGDDSEDIAATVSAVVGYLEGAKSIFVKIGLADYVVESEWAIAHLHTASSYVTDDPLYHLAAAQLAVQRIAQHAYDTTPEFFQHKMRMQSGPGYDVGRLARKRSLWDHGINYIEKNARDGAVVQSSTLLDGAERALHRRDPHECRRFLDIWRFQHSELQNTLLEHRIDDASFTDIHQALKFRSIAAQLSEAEDELDSALGSYENVWKRRASSLGNMQSVVLARDAAELARKWVNRTVLPEPLQRALKILCDLSDDILDNLSYSAWHELLTMRGRMAVGLAFTGCIPDKEQLLECAISDLNNVVTRGIEKVKLVASPANQDEILQRVSATGELVSHLHLIVGDISAAFQVMSLTRGYRLRSLANNPAAKATQKPRVDLGNAHRETHVMAKNLDQVANSVIDSKRSARGDTDQLKRVRVTRDRALARYHRMENDTNPMVGLSPGLPDITSALALQPSATVISFSQNDIGGAAIVSSVEMDGAVTHEKVGLPALRTKDLQGLCNDFQEVQSSIRGVAGGEFSGEDMYLNLTRADRKLRALCQELFKAVFEPVFQQTSALYAGEVFLFAPGRLASLPLHLAFGKLPGTEQSNYLCQNNCVSYWPATTPLVQRLRNNRPKERIEVASAVIDANLDSVFPEGWFENELGLPIDLGSGTAEPLHSLNASDLGVVICHARWNSENLEECGLLIDEQFISIEEASRLHLDRNPVVVIAACDSGVFDTQFACNEFIGMPAALLQAGARAVVGAMWPIQAATAKAFVNQFVKEIVRTPNEVAAAVLRAQKGLIEIDSREAEKTCSDHEQQLDDVDHGKRVMANHSSPLHWGAFFLLGG